MSLGDTVMGARPRRWRRLALLGILLLAVLVVWLLSSDLPLEAWLAGLRGWIAVRGWWGALCLVVVIAIWNLLLPPTPLQFLAAAVYGVVGGMLVFYLGATLAVIAVAGIVRTWGREVIERQLTRRPRIGLIERALVHHGWRAVILLRLAGGIPSNVANLLLGCSRLPLWTIVWASWVGKFPGILLMALLGAASGRLVEEGAAPERGTWVLLVVGVAATTVLIVVIGRTARRLWQEELAAEAGLPAVAGDEDSPGMVVEVARPPA